MRKWLGWIPVLTGFLVCNSTEAAGKAHHVVVVVWDGMRPDFVTPELTPRLWKMASGGVTFANHHPVYLSATEVNGTAIATGAYPQNSDIIANKEFRPDIDSHRPIHMEEIAAIRKGDELTHGGYLHRATVAETVQKAGLRTAVAGGKPVAVLHDRAARPEGALNQTLFAEQSLPPSLAMGLAAEQGAFPEGGTNSPTRNDWATKGLLEHQWKDGVPAYTLLWMSEPDFSQHKQGPGSEMALVALKNVDDNLGRVLDALAAKGALEDTDVFLVSDHGFSTIGQRVDVTELLIKAGFKAINQVKTKLESGEILQVSNGGACLFYVAGHEQAVIARLVEHLQTQDYAGVVFTKKAMPGTFAFADAKLDSPDAPDVVLSMRWTGGRSTNGTRGMITSAVYDYGEKGMHVSLSKYDMHNTLIAAGPDFRKGIVDQLPSGNVDVAPTVLHILGLKTDKPMDGRVLAEAMTGDGPKLKSYEPKRLETSRKIGNVTWHQYLNFTELNGVVYLDEGNGWQAGE